jgi:hypothetical protein
MEILRQEDQWPDRVAAGRESHESPWHHEDAEDAFYYDPPEMENLEAEHGGHATFGAITANPGFKGHGSPGSFYDGEVQKKPVMPHNDNQYLRGEDTGLYGEDEDHTYDVIARPSPDGKGFDVLKSFG